MKVVIGNYKSWFGIYQCMDLLQYVGVSEDKCHDLAQKSPEWIANMFEWIHSKRKRKIKIHIDAFDVWGMDHTLALIIHPMLVKLKATKNGSPLMEEHNMTSYGSCQYCFDFYKDGDDLAWETGFQKWDKIMDKMIFSFNEIAKDDKPDFFIVAPEMDLTKHPEDEGKLTIPVRWKVEGVYDKEASDAYHKKIQEGLNLFATYYESLWD
jgi:hypothetical protein